MSEDQILGWADAFFERTGEWPDWQSGPILEAHGDTWYTIAAALALGLRGLPPGGSLQRLIHDKRGRTNEEPPRYSADQILGWADAWHARTGEWPTKDSGEIPGSRGLEWSTVDRTLRTRAGVLKGGWSLRHLLAKERGAGRRPPVTERQIVFWAEAYYRRNGRWPRAVKRQVPGSPGDTWRVLNSALKEGTRALPGGSSLAQLLLLQPPPVTQDDSGVIRVLEVSEILAWADAHHARTGNWPSVRSGSIPEAPGMTWRGVQHSFRQGTRGLPRGSSVAQLLAENRGVPRLGRRPKNRIGESGSAGFANPVLYSS